MSFYLDPNTEINPNDIGFTYDVKFSPPSKGTVKTKDGPGMKAYLSTLTFSNSVTGMNDVVQSGYQALNSALIFSTIAAIVIKYFERNTKTMAITFTAAQQDLHKAYKILAREAEKKGPLIWANPSDSPTAYYIVRKDVYKKYLQRLGA